MYNGDGGSLHLVHSGGVVEDCLGASLAGSDEDHDVGLAGFVICVSLLCSPSPLVSLKMRLRSRSRSI